MSDANEHGPWPDPMAAIRAAMEKAPLVPHPLAAGAVTPYDALLQARNMSKIPPEKPEQDEKDTPKDGIRVTADGEDEDENDQKSKNDNKAATRDPVNAVTGEVVLSQTDFTVPWRIPVPWTRHYGHQRRHTGLCGLNWHSPADIRLQLKANGKVLFYGPDPKAHVFKRLDNARPVREVSDGALLERCEQGLRVTTKQGLSYHFAEPDPKKRSQTLYVEKITDRCGNRLHYERDEHGLCRIGDNSGNALAVRTRMGRIVTIHLALESGDRLLARYDYDPQNNLFTVFDALNTSHRFAYEKKALVRHTDRTGFSVHYQYDNKGRCIRVTGDDRYYYGELEYGDGCTTVTDSLGHQQVFEYNAAGRITAIIAPDGGKTRYTYDSAGRTKTVTDPAGNTTEYSYDNAGNLDEVVYADGANLLISYNADHRPGSIQLPGCPPWIFDWNARGLLEKRMSPSGAQTHYQYNDHGDLISIRDPLGATVKIQRDDKGRAVAVTAPPGQVTTCKRDDMGDVIAVTDPQGRKTSYRYDQKRRLVQTRLPSGRAIAIEYDPKDRPIRYSDDTGRSTSLTYTGTGRVATHTDPNGAVTAYGYDTETRLIRVTDPKGRTYRFKRDPSGRIIESADYWGGVRRYRYDLAGRPVQYTDPTGAVTRFECDPVGRIVKKIFEDGAQETFQYDMAGNLKVHQNANSRSQCTYDLENRPFHERQGDFQITHSFDINGLHLGKDLTPGGSIDYAYDPIGRLSAITFDKKPVLKITRDEQGRPVSELLGGRLQRYFHYDELNRLTRQCIDMPNGVDQRTYTYNADGHLTEINDLHQGLTQYAYDPAGRLTGHRRPHGDYTGFELDPAGDILAEGEPDGQSHRTETFVNSRYGFDTAGRMTLRATRNAIVDLQWDPSDRLTCAAKRHGSQTRMAYDSLGRRVSKTTDEGTTGFVWDQGKLMAEQTPNGLRQYLYYPGTFIPLALVDTDNQIYYFHNDPSGLPVRLTDAHGNTVWEARHDALGNIEKQSANKIDNPIRFQGQYHDKETGLHYNLHRYYDPDTGRYISQDPIGLAGGINQYVYVQNNPVNLIDPFGLDSLTNSMISVYGLHSRPMNHNDPISNSTNAIASHLYHAYADYDFHRASKEASAYLNSDYVQKQFQTLISFAVDTPSGETAIGLNYLELAINLKGNPKALIIRGLIAGGELYLLKKEELKDKTCDE